VKGFKFKLSHVAARVSNKKCSRTTQPQELDAQMLREAVARAAGAESDDDGGDSTPEDDDDVDVDVASEASSAAEGEAEGEPDFFMDSAMRGLNLDGGVDTHAKSSEEGQGPGSGSDGEETAGESAVEDGSRGIPGANTGNRSRGLFDFGSSSSSDGSGSDSSDKDSSDSDSDSDSDVGEWEVPSRW